MPNVGLGVQAITNPNGTITVSVPSTALGNVGFYQTNDGSVNLGPVGGVAPGASATFSVTQGYFFAQGITAESSFTVTQVTTGNKLYELQTTGTVVTNTTTETITAQCPIPAGLIGAGNTLAIRWAVQATAVNSTNTFQPILRLGPLGTIADAAIYTGTAVNPTVGWQSGGEMKLVSRAAPSATSAIVGTGYAAPFGAVGTTVVSEFIVPTNFATNGILYLSLTLTQSAASAGNTGVAELFEVLLG